MARGLKFRIQKVEGLYYPCSESKGADQLRGHREADLRLCFRICKMPVFSRRGSLLISVQTNGFSRNGACFQNFVYNHYNQSKTITVFRRDRTRSDLR